MICPECKQNCSTYRDEPLLLSYCCEAVIDDGGVFLEEDLFLLYDEENDLLPFEITLTELM